MAKQKQFVLFLYGFVVICSWVLFAVYAAEDDQYISTVTDIAEPSVDVVEDVTKWDLFVKFVKSLKGSSIHTHVWPDLEIGWRIIVGTLLAFGGAAFGSAGGIGAGGIFVPILTLIIGFDAKSSAAISKCMIMGLSAATIYFNIKQRHPTLERPVIDYDLALVVQPMLLLGISIGVTLNVIFANWMVTVSLIVAFLATSTRSFFKGIEMWKKETIKKKEAAQRVKSGHGVGEIEYKPLLGDPIERPRVSVIENVNWKLLIILVVVWLAFLGIQILKDFTSTCSMSYWVLNVLQTPVAVGATLYQALALFRKRGVDNSTEEADASCMTSRQIIFSALIALLAGTLGGLLGLGGGFLLGPLFLEIGIIPQVSSATATFVMTFSASMCAIEYFLLDRFPVPYAAYLVVIAIIASLTGQYVVKKWIARAGRASLIVFILSSIIFASAVLLGGEGIVDMVYKIKHNEYMGFEDLCTSG
ncbi:hypothetical protein RND81_14G164900 [Saponaria officinalis]|uniref:Sulfite exporter TauE/SafE family protein n=1 Tax=Saponaria officinalis TaxID=3572 RepID=A0AAW1GR79_SAPOF